MKKYFTDTPGGDHFRPAARILLVCVALLFAGPLLALLLAYPRVLYVLLTGLYMFGAGRILVVIVQGMQREFRKLKELNQIAENAA